MPTLHPKRKSFPPQAGQTPYSRSSVTSSPSKVCNRRPLLPVGSGSCPQSGHIGLSPGWLLLQSVAELARAVSWSIWPRNFASRRSSSFSISSKVALGFRSRHSLHSSDYFFAQLPPSQSQILQLHDTHPSPVFQSPSAILPRHPLPTEKSDGHPFDIHYAKG